MTVTKRRIAALVVAGAVGLGIAAVAVPAVAGIGPFGGPGAAASGPGRANGMGPGGWGMTAPGGATGPAQGDCIGAGAAATGTLTAEQRSALVATAQDEKLAHDVYAALADRYGAVIFDRIAAAETQHLAAVRALLDRYGLADPTAGLPDGSFSDPTVQAGYDGLLATAQADLAAALAVGQTIEQASIESLNAALTGLGPPDVTRVYTNLARASQQHLAAFQQWS